MRSSPSSRPLPLASFLAVAACLIPAATLLAQVPPAPAPPPAAVVNATPAPAPPGAPEIIWSQVRVKEPFIAMTFDDGPHPALTPQLLDLLAQKHLHVTFFVIGQMAKERPDLLKRAIAEGHEIGNHSYTHPNLAKMSDEAVRGELNRTKEIITAAIGKPVTLMRPPYGSLSKAQQRWVHDDLGYKIILWDVDPLDWKRPGPDAVTRRIVEGAHNGSIILAHDIHPGTVQAMPATFDGLLNKGFKFVTVSELLAMELPPEPKPSAGLKKPGSAPRAATTPGPGMPEKLTGAPDSLPPATAPVPVPGPAASPSATPAPPRR